MRFAICLIWSRSVSTRASSASACRFWSDRIRATRASRSALPRISGSEHCRQLGHRRRHVDGLVLWLQQISGHMRLGGNRLVQRLIAAARIGAHQDQVAILVVERGRPLQRARRRHMLARSEEHTYELQSLMRISYDVFSLKKNKKKTDKQENK